MSRSHQKIIRCERCNAQQLFTVWESISVTVNPGLKKKLLDGSLTTFCCSRCGYEEHVAFDCLYHDMDKSLAIWLKEADDDESKLAKQMFLATTQIKTSRTVRSIDELNEKIRVFEDGLDDFEIELFKFVTCARRQLKMGLPFHYTETRTSFFGRNSLVFAVAIRGEFETIDCSFKDYEAAVQLTHKVRHLIPHSAFEWANLNHSFIFQVLESTGMIGTPTPQPPKHKTICVRTLGRNPEFDDRHEFDDWLDNGGKTYSEENWRVGVDVSVEQAAKYLDPQTGELYLYYQIVEGEWKGRFVSRALFAQLKAIEDERG